MPLNCKKTNLFSLKENLRENGHNEFRRFLFSETFLVNIEIFNESDSLLNLF